MKTTKLIRRFLVLVLLMTFIGNVYGNPQSIYFPSENIVSRLDRMNKLGEQVGQVVTYNKTTIGSKQLSSFTAKTNNMEEWLYESLKGTRLTYRKIRDKYYSVFSKPGQTPEEILVDEPKKSGTLSGKIVDEHGEGLPGATIKAVGKNIGTATDINGNFRFSLPAGTYTLEAAYIGYQTQQITDVRINAGKNTPLDIALNIESTQLGEVVVTANYNKASTNGMLRIQQAKAEVSSVISAQQISTLPDKNVGEVLKRISGVSTINNSKVIVRGIAERYNVAQLDGVTLPSTDVQSRDFEFNIIPSGLIDNVVVSKSYMPDMSFGFGGGLVQISTISVPDENFINFSIGSKYSPQYTGQKFLGYGRGKYDYLGYDDGSRDHFPDDLVNVTHSNFLLNSTSPDDADQPLSPDVVREQNRRIGGMERLGTRRYKTLPGQNYKFSIGRSFNLSANNLNRLGFVGALTYRNEQVIENILHYERGPFNKREYNRYDSETEKQYYENSAKNYKFNVTWSALFNAGWKTEYHKVFFKNMYSRVFNNAFYRIVGTGEDLKYEMYKRDYPAIREYDSPKFLDLLQNKLEGEHKFGHFTLNWTAARGKVINNEIDAVEAYLKPRQFANIPEMAGGNEKPPYRFNENNRFYSYILGYFGPGAKYTPNLNRSQYYYDETNWTAEGALSYDFKILKQRQKIKAGVQFLKRYGKFHWTKLQIGGKSLNDKYRNMPIWAIDMSLKEPENDVFYFLYDWDVQRYEGKNTNLAYFGMMDNRITKWMRIVWGMRIESYVYDEIYSQGSDYFSYVNPDGSKIKRFFVNKETGRVVSERTDVENEELKWRYLPSVSLTITPMNNLNLRGSYAKSVVRPGLIENSKFTRFNPEWGTEQINEGVISTQITHYDAKLEWFPSAGELFSVAYFYKDFENPVELYRGVFDTSQKVKVVTQNSKSAKVKGWEFDLRKNLGFLIPEFSLMRNFSLYGNLTYQESEVQARFFDKEFIGRDNQGDGYYMRIEKLLKMKRPLYGQVPWLYNIGVQYEGKRLGLNAAFNHMGHKTFTTSANPRLVEYERERDQLDAQISYNFLKDKNLKLKLNISNILNTPYHFYTNGSRTYELKEYDSEKDYWQDSFEWKYGFDEKYQWGYLEKVEDTAYKKRIGDVDTYIKKTGTSFSLSLSYLF